MQATLNLPAAAEAAWPLIIHAQRGIHSAASLEAARCEKLWAAHEAKVKALAEKLQKRRVKPSSRLTQGTNAKTDEEYALDVAGAPLKAKTKTPCLSFYFIASVP